MGYSLLSDINYCQCAMCMTFHLVRNQGVLPLLVVKNWKENEAAQHNVPVKQLKLFSTRDLYRDR
jgi:hypothetical protein